MTFSTMLRQRSAIVPIVLALAALATIGTHVALYGTAPQSDEGAAAHIWQLLMLAQLPAIAFFALRWLPRAPREAMLMLALQFVAIVAALAPVFLLGF